MFFPVFCRQIPSETERAYYRESPYFPIYYTRIKYDNFINSAIKKNNDFCIFFKSYGINIPRPGALKNVPIIVRTYL